MLEFFGWATPNSNRVSIMLEELGLAYRVRPVNIRKREQFAPEILALNPYGKIPILKDDGDEPLVLFESGAILIHLAERHGRFLPTSTRERAEVLKWLMVALTAAGPYTGQAHHWTELAAERPEVAVRHHVGLVARVYRVLDERLAASRYLADDYSIADIALYPWIARHHWAAQSLDDTPSLKRWYAEVGARPAVKRGMLVPAGARLE